MVYVLREWFQGSGYVWSLGTTPLIQRVTNSSPGSGSINIILSDLFDLGLVVMFLKKQY